MGKPVTLVHGARFPASTDMVAEKKLLDALPAYAAHANALLAAHGAAIYDAPAEATAARRAVTASFSTRLISAIDANKRRPRHARLPLVDLADGVADLKLEKPCPEPVRLRAFPKKSGGHRPISSFDMAHRTAQALIRRMVAPDLHLRSYQYDFRGVHAANTAVQAAIMAGKTELLLLDIQNFYGSLDSEALREDLPLPRRTVDHYVSTKLLNFVPGSSNMSVPFHALLPEARKGAPQGSSATPIIGAWAISKCAWMPAPDIVAVGYVDDFLLAGSCAADVAVNAINLSAAMAAHPSGHFKTTIKAQGNIADPGGVEFLGVRFCQEGGVRLALVSPDNAVRFHAVVIELFDAALEANLLASYSKAEDDRTAALEAVADLWSYISGWLSAFRLCDDIDGYAEDASEYLDQVLADGGFTKADLAAIMTKKGQWHGY